MLPFRAVHSIKGGAAAFGFDGLISFAHIFEEVLDLGRSGQVELGRPACKTLLRASDIMERLIEDARAGLAVPPESAAKMINELQQLSSSTSIDDFTGSSAAKLDLPSGALIVLDHPEKVKNIKPNEVKVHFKPDPGFHRAGHDLLKLVKAAKVLGLSKAEVDGNVATLSEFNFDEIELSWWLTFETEKPVSDFETFFLVYEAAATWEIFEAFERIEPTGQYQ